MRVEKVGLKVGEAVTVDVRRTRAGYEMRMCAPVGGKPREVVVTLAARRARHLAYVLGMLRVAVESFAEDGDAEAPAATEAPTATGERVTLEARNGRESAGDR